MRERKPTDWGDTVTAVAFMLFILALVVIFRTT